MSDLAIAIAANLALGILLLPLLLRSRTDQVRARTAAEALQIYRRHFPDALGTVLLGHDGRSALIELADGGLGLLQRHGQRWNARALAPGELAEVRAARDGSILVRFTDFGWPRARLVPPDAAARQVWLARLQPLVRAHGAAGEPHHA